MDLENGSGIRSITQEKGSVPPGSRRTCEGCEDRADVPWSSKWNPNISRLTEDAPTIKPYDEVGWANTAEYSAISVSDALDFLTLLHKKLVALLRSLNEADLQRSFNHPVSGTVKLGKNIGLYAWHGNHHLAHITELCQREGWNISHGQEEAN